MCSSVIESEEPNSRADLSPNLAEEFAIYLNYVRKLGFEETPDYDFLRELFTKVLKNSGEAEDGVYDWMLLNNGKGWEAGVGFSTLSLVGFRLTCFTRTGHLRRPARRTE